MSDDGPPVIGSLDFSEFHPLDHRPGDAYCRSLPGGWRDHLKLAWEYKWKPNLGAATWCRIGRLLGWNGAHHWLEGWHHGDPRSVCRNCYRSRPRN